MQLNGWLEGIGHIVQTTVGKGVKVGSVLSPDLPAIDATPTQMLQIVLNLATSARDAMSGAGQLSLETTLSDSLPAGALLSGKMARPGDRPASEGQMAQSGDRPSTGVAPSSSSHAWEEEFQRAGAAGSDTVEGTTSPSVADHWRSTLPGLPAAPTQRSATRGGGTAAGSTSEDAIAPAGVAGPGWKQASTALPAAPPPLEAAIQVTPSNGKESKGGLPGTLKHLDHLRGDSAAGSGASEIGPAGVAGAVWTQVSPALPAAQAPKPGAPRWVVLRISDTGRATMQQLEARINQLYFSATPIGGGAARGLATVADVIADLGGAIQLECQPGRFNSINVYLPAAKLTPLAAKDTALLTED